MAGDRLPRATLEQKIQILDFYHSSNRPQSETVDRYKNQLSISTSSFSEWLKNEDDLRSRLTEADTDFTKQSRRKVKFKYEKINRAMDLLVQQKLERGESVNEPILREHWSIYAHQYGVDDPKRLVGFSHGWLSQFKKRHGLNKKRMSGSPPGSRNGSTSAVVGAVGGGSGGANGVAKPNGTPGTAQAARDSEIYDTSFSTDPNNNGTNTGTDHDNSSTDFTSNSGNNNSYDLMGGQHGAGTTNSQYRQPALGYGTSHMNFGNYPLYPPGQQPYQAGQPGQPQTGQAAGQGQGQGQAAQAAGSNIAFEYPDQYRNQYTKEVQQTAAQIQAQAQAQAQASARAASQQQQHHQQIAGQQILPNQQAGKTNARRSGQEEFASSINGSDIERFIYMFADRYFHENASAYPQTIKVFQEFKTTFLNESMHNSRTMHQQNIMSQAMNRASSSSVSNIDEFLRSGGLPQPGSNGEAEERSILNNGMNKWKK